MIKQGRITGSVSAKGIIFKYNFPIKLIGKNNCRMQCLGEYYRKWGMKTIYSLRKGKNKMLRDMLAFGKGSLILVELV